MKAGTHMGKTLGFLSLLLLFFGCLNSNPSSLVEILENHYPHVKINNPGQKQSTIAEIKAMLKSSPHSYKLNRLIFLINKMGDGNLIILPNKPKVKFSSGLYFHFGKKVYLINNERDTSLKHIAEVVSVNGIPLQKWLEQRKDDVNFSTFWGRNYKALNLLSINDDEKSLPKSLTSKSTGNITFNYEINWKPIKNTKCVDEGTLNNKTYLLKISSFSCSNYQERLIKKLKDSKKYQALVIDLRDNEGGVETNAQVTLESTLTKKAFFYKFKEAINSSKNKWKPEQIKYIHPHNDSEAYVGHKSIAVLINQGCSGYCEVLASVFKFGAKYKVIGKRTHGSFSLKNSWKIPNSNYTL